MEEVTFELGLECTGFEHEETKRGRHSKQNTLRFGNGKC